MLNDNDNESRLSSKNSRYFVQLSPDKAPITIREQDVSELKGDMETSFLRYQQEIAAMISKGKIDLVMIGQLSLGDKMKYELMVQYYKSQQEL